MKLIVTFLAGALVAAGVPDGAPIYPAPGQSATYRIHNVLPRHGSSDDVVTVRTIDDDNATISLAGAPPMHVSIGAHEGDADPHVAPILEALDATNAVAQTALAGGDHVDIPAGPRGESTAHLSIATNGDRVVAMGSADFDGPRGPLGMSVVIRITLRNGRVIDSTGSVIPKSGRGPAGCWKLTLQS